MLSRFRPRHRQRGNALLIAMGLLILLAAGLEAAQYLTSALSKRTDRNGQFLRTEAAAEAGVEAMFGRFTKWVTVNGASVPSDTDTQTPGIPGNAAFPAICAVPAVPADSALADYTLTCSLVPILPDDSYVSDSTKPNYLPSLSGPRKNVADNSPTSPVRFYFTKSATPLAHSIPSRTVTYRATATAKPKNPRINSSGAVTVVRYMRCDSINPFSWLSYQNGRKNGGGGTIYRGPIYAATVLDMSYVTFMDSVLYGLSYNVPGDSWLGGGQASQLHQVTPFSLIPDLVNNLSHDTNGNRVASAENNNTPDASGVRPADAFSTRELIEPPTNPANDTTPQPIKVRRIYNQADARIKILATTTTLGGVTKTTATATVVNVDGTPTLAPWAPALAAAFTTKTATDPNGFYDRSRSSSVPIQVTDVNVGLLKTVMEANATAFPTGIIYAWDATGLDSGPRPMTGMRVANAGQLPDVTGLTFGTNDPVYLRGDFNTGATLNNPANLESGLRHDHQPASDDLSKVPTYGTTDPSQRVTSDYTVKPGAVFGDSVTELSNNWQDKNSLSGSNAVSTTTNLVEGWSTMNSNELRSDDTYIDQYGQANPLWIENWGGSRRTMSGEEMVLWHSRFNAGAYQGIGGGWSGDISYDFQVSRLPLNWGSLSFVRDRYARR